MSRHRYTILEQSRSTKTTVRIQIMTPACSKPAQSLVSLLTLIVLLSGVSPPAVAEPPADLELEQVLSGLARPVIITHAGDDTGRLFIVEKPGRVLVWDGVSAPTTFLGIEGLVDDGGNEQGLLGLAFHPDYPTNGLFYVNYTRDAGAGLDRTVIARYSVSAGDPDLADAGSALTVLEIEQDFSNHNGGNILFGPDGYLYIGMGDGGSGGDPFDRAQDLAQLLGKMLRIDVDGTQTRGGELCGLSPAYGIPPDNPFVGTTGTCDEIWSYGMRNPWRFSFDRITGDLLIGDVGQSAWEEIDFEPAGSAGGLNYGWNCFEGAHIYPGGSTCSGPVVDPILEYSHGGGRCSVTGGYRYGGSGIVGLAGTYLYADYCTGQIWFGTEDGGSWSSTEWANTVLNVTSFGEDQAGELYVVDEDTIHRLQSPSSIFCDGFESGNTEAW